jgi:hypothetical protein
MEDKVIRKPKASAHPGKTYLSYLDDLKSIQENIKIA